MTWWVITLVVMVPVAFFPKTGIDAYSPMGTVIIGGLLVGTVLSLIDIPIMHSLVDDLQRWLESTFEVATRLRFLRSTSPGPSILKSFAHCSGCLLP